MRGTSRSTTRLHGDRGAPWTWTPALHPARNAAARRTVAERAGLGGMTAPARRLSEMTRRAPGGADSTRGPLGPARDRPGGAAGGLAQGAPGDAREPWTAERVARRVR